MGASRIGFTGGAARKRTQGTTPTPLVKLRGERTMFVRIDPPVLLTAGMAPEVIATVEREIGRPVRTRIVAYDAALGVPQWLRVAMGESQ